MLGKDADHGRADSDGFMRVQNDARVGGELPVARDAAEHDAEINTCRQALAFAHAHGLEADVVGVGDGGDCAAIVERHVELAWQAEQIARVEDVVRQAIGIGAHVEQRLWIDPTERRRGDVADVVRAGTARAHAERGEFIQHRHEVLRLELANLYVRARRQVGAAAAPVLRHLRQPAQLAGSQDGTGNARAQHKRVLRGRDVEESVELEAVSVFRVGRLVFVRVRQQLVPGVERVALVLPQLFAAKILNRRAVKQHGQVLRAGVWFCRDLPRCGMARKGHALGDAGEKALQILRLLRRKRLTGSGLERRRGLRVDLRIRGRGHRASP